MYRQTLVSTILLTCLVAALVGLGGVAAIPTTVSADGGQSDPPNSPAPPDSTSDAIGPVGNSEVANRSLKQNLPIDLAVEIMIRAIML